MANKFCSIFGKETYQVSIKQCILVKDEYLIRKLEKKIVEDVKKELVQLWDIKQRQKVCLTRVDRQGTGMLTCEPRSRSLIA